MYERSMSNVGEIIRENITEQIDEMWDERGKQSFRDYVTSECHDLLRTWDESCDYGKGMHTIIRKGIIGLANADRDGTDYDRLGTTALDLLADALIDRIIQRLSNRLLDGVDTHRRQVAAYLDED